MYKIQFGMKLDHKVEKVKNVFRFLKENEFLPLINSTENMKEKCFVVLNKVNYQIK